MKTREVSLNVTFIGAAGVGKTAVVDKFTKIGYEFNTNYKATIGVELRTRKVQTTDNTPVTLRCWDTTGQERSTKISQSYLSSTDIIVGCFDLERAETLDYLKSMLVGRAKQLRRGASMPRIVMLGCKADLIIDYTEVNNKFNEFLEVLNKHDIAIEQNDRYDTSSSKLNPNNQDELLQKLQPTIDKVVHEKLAQQEKATPEADAAQITVNDPIIAPTPTLKPSALESVKNFFKNKNVQRTLIAIGATIGIALLFTGFGMGMLALAGVASLTVASVALTASMVAAFGGSVGFGLSLFGMIAVGAAVLAGLMGYNFDKRPKPKVEKQTIPDNTNTPIDGCTDRTNHTVNDRLTKEQRANGGKLPSEVASETDARTLKQQRAAQDATLHQYSNANTLNQMGVYAASTTNPTLTETLTPPQQCTIL